MKPDVFHDAMTLLPEDLLEPVDALRQKKRFPWKSLLTTAACFCLVLGLALGYAQIVAPASAENAAGDAAEMPMQEAVTQSQTKEDAPSLVEVVEVADDHIMVVTAVENSSDSCALRAPIKILFDKLSQIPALQEGQIIEIYWETEDYDSAAHSIAPYRIVVSEE